MRVCCDRPVQYACCATACCSVPLLHYPWLIGLVGSLLHLLVTYPTSKMSVLQMQQQKEEAADKDASIWDWTPPGDLAETGAWKVLRELAMTLSKCALPSYRCVHALNRLPWAAL